MNTTAYEQRRSQIEHYFDRTAADAWARLTSNEPVGRIRATVRAGRDTMRETLLSWLPQDLRGLRVLDAGCGTGALALQAALRGADVMAIDLSPTLVKLAAERMAAEPGSKAYGALSVAVQYYTKPHVLMIVPPRSFIPAPAVDSAVICCERREKPAVEVEDEALFFRVVKAAFGQRRKTLANALKAGGFPQEQLQLVLAKAGIDAMRRGETLSLDEFAAIANGLFAQKRTEEKL